MTGSDEITVENKGMGSIEDEPKVKEHRIKSRFEAHLTTREALDIIFSDSNKPIVEFRKNNTSASFVEYSLKIKINGVFYSLDRKLIPVNSSDS